MKALTLDELATIRLLAEVRNRKQGTEIDKTEHLQEVY
jgi:hypothetical protein